MNILMSLSSKHVVILENCGPVDVFVEVERIILNEYLIQKRFKGDLERLRESLNIILTIHDVGSSYLSWKKFTSHQDMEELKSRKIFYQTIEYLFYNVILSRSLFLHISLPGQGPTAGNLDKGFPTMQVLPHFTTHEQTTILPGSWPQLGHGVGSVEDTESCCHWRWGGWKHCRSV